MKLLYQILLGIHIASGTISLLSGAIAIAVKKGQKNHQWSGMVFFSSMVLVCFTALSISILKHHVFLMHIGIFSFFLLYSGFRSIRNKSLRPNTLDIVVLLIGFLNAVSMIISAQVILLCFGILGCILSLRDMHLIYLVVQQKRIQPNAWLLRHIGMMLGAYISTLTAFVVVNVSWASYPWIPWLAPTIVGAPLIAFWTKKYQSKKTSI